MSATNLIENILLCVLFFFFNNLSNYHDWRQFLIIVWCAYSLIYLTFQIFIMFIIRYHIKKLKQKKNTEQVNFYRIEFKIFLKSLKKQGKFDSRIKIVFFFNLKNDHWPKTKFSEIKHCWIHANTIFFRFVFVCGLKK